MTTRKEPLSTILDGLAHYILNMKSDILDLRNQLLDHIDQEAQNKENPTASKPKDKFTCVKCGAVCYEKEFDMIGYMCKPCARETVAASERKKDQAQKEKTPPPPETSCEIPNCSNIPKTGLKMCDNCIRWIIKKTKENPSTSEWRWDYWAAQRDDALAKEKSTEY